MMLKAKQKGFTLLELLVVITLLAILSVGALVAYDGLTEKAQAAATSNNTTSVDRAIRAYRIIAQQYPTQWDNLANPTAATGHLGLASATQAVLADFDTSANASLSSAVFASLEAVGIKDLQEVTALAPNVVPNLQHNEGANPSANEIDVDAAAHLAILPTQFSVGLKYDGTAATAADSLRLNKLNDSFAADTDALVIALGFGHDAAHSTTDSKAAIATPATYTSAKVDPSKNYARYIGLFHVGTAAASGTPVAVSDIHQKAHFIGMIDPEGNGIDDNIAAAIAN